jgi:hypothetical protein
VPSGITTCHELRQDEFNLSSYAEALSRSLGADVSSRMTGPLIEYGCQPR